MTVNKLLLPVAVLGLLLSLAAAQQNPWYPCFASHLDSESSASRTHDTDVAHNSITNRYMVVYIDTYINEGNQYPNTSVMAQLMDWNGAKVGPVRTIFGMEQSANYKRIPRVIYHEGIQKFLVTFEYDFVGDLSDFDILGQLTDNNGVPLGDPFAISGSDGNEEHLDLIYAHEIRSFALAFELLSTFSTGGVDYTTRNIMLEIFNSKFNSTDTTSSAYLNIGIVNADDGEPTLCFDSKRNQFLVAWVYKYTTTAGTPRQVIVGSLVNQTGHVVPLQNNAAIAILASYRDTKTGEPLDSIQPDCVYNTMMDSYFLGFGVEYDDGTIKAYGLGLSASNLFSSDAALVYMGTPYPQDSEIQLAYSPHTSEIIGVMESGYPRNGSYTIQMVNIQATSATDFVRSESIQLNDINAANSNISEYGPRIAYNSLEKYKFLVSWSHSSVETPSGSITTSSPTTSPVLTTAESTTAAPATSADATTADGTTAAGTTAAGTTAAETTAAGTTADGTTAAGTTAAETTGAPATSSVETTGQTPATSNAETTGQTPVTPATSNAETTGQTPATPATSNAETTGQTPAEPATSNAETTGQTIAAPATTSQDPARSAKMGIARSVEDIGDIQLHFEVSRVRHEKREFVQRTVSESVLSTVRRQTSADDTQIETRLICTNSTRDNDPGHVEDDDDDDDDEGDGNRKGKIAAGILVPLFVIAAIVGAVIAFRVIRKRRAAKNRYAYQGDENSEDINLANFS